MENKLINIISKALLDEEVVCFPTETVMGLAVIAENYNTYNKLVTVKNRPSNKVFPVCLLKEDIKKYCYVNELQQKIIDKFLPGPLTIILNKLESTPSFIGNDLGTVALRVSDDRFVMNILNSIKKPIFLTSANLSGEEVAKDALEAQTIFKDKVKYYVDGKLIGKEASTIVDLTSSTPKIIRKGPISEEQILKVWEGK